MKLAVQYSFREDNVYLQKGETMSAINPRAVIAQILLEIMQEDGYNTVTLQRNLIKNGAMSPRDRGFVTNVVNGTLRNIYYIDYLLDKTSKLPAKKMKPYILAVLRTAVYQLLFMDKVPESAVINEAVKLIKEKGLGQLSGFANGVLRSIARDWNQIPLPDKAKDPIAYLSIRYSHPDWLLKLWIHQYGFDFVESICEKNNTSPAVTICCNTTKIQPETLAQNLTDKGVSVTAGKLIPEALRLVKTDNIGKMDSFLQGLFHVQDESSLLAVSVLDPKPHEHILDTCSAPGGKSFAIAEKMGNKGKIISRDIHPHKIALVEEGAKRLGLSIITCELFDAKELDEKSIGAYDRVLIDAPCSGLGLMRKKPDIRLKKSGSDIDALEILQKEILTQGAMYVKPGGVLVYSTCTICKKENEKNVAWFLEKHKEYELEDVTPYLPQGVAPIEGQKGMVQLFPHIHDTDGFFIARFRRKEG